MFDGFTLTDIAIPGLAPTGGTIRTRVGGAGPPLLLLHGFPQTHVMWHKAAPALQQRFTLVLADLRGYGDSAKPPSMPDHAPYSKRAMAQDMAEVMTTLGHERFGVVGHDRGGRVAHRLALDHADRVTRLMTLDIAPTYQMYHGTNFDFARAYFHWFFLIQQAPLPERLIGNDPEFYIQSTMSRGQAGLSPFTPQAWAEYVRCFSLPATIHAACEDYRASATIDLAHDEADGGAKVVCPMRVLWGGQSPIWKKMDPLAEWRKRASDVSGSPIDSGHYIPEEAPDALTAEIDRFFSRP